MSPRRVVGLIGVAGTALSVACGSLNTPVPVAGPPADVAELAGHWEGTYRSSVTGRSGVIEFQLEAERDTAFGSVVMLPNEPSAFVRGYDPASPSAPQWLDINFVRCERGQVTGTLGPYGDPETGEALLTVFQGFIDGDRIEGTFATTVQATGDMSTGQWEVQRKPTETGGG